MGSVPAFLLKKLYVKGSLKNTSSGFELSIQNTLAPGTIAGLEPLKVDGVEYPLAQTFVVLADGNRLCAFEVSSAAPLRFDIGARVTLQVEGKPLSTGSHTMTVSPKTREAGRLEITAQDSITQDEYAPA